MGLIIFIFENGRLNKKMWVLEGIEEFNRY